MDLTHILFTAKRWLPEEVRTKFVWLIPATLARFYQEMVGQRSETYLRQLETYAERITEQVT